MLRSGSAEGLHEVGGGNSEATGLGLDVGNSSKLGGVSSHSVSTDGGSGADDSSVDGAGDAIALLEIQLGEVEISLVVSIVILKILPGRLVDDLLHLEPLDGLVLGIDSAAVEAVDHVGVSLILFTSSVVSSSSGTS
eukprot:CAMPEP_0170484834 /NCGR_PEP_ID=MMETSP0208-20121228/4209_1 /TAXON_ID=197538 /ORGANISM="Strombidium inclinatum, Strain S3" /LENGTH=136 /DNA_ID=CAMNT_0010758279 /DNA_START=149 /DNA_END=559 /DNA_ORIENTATION=-